MSRLLQTFAALALVVAAPLAAPASAQEVGGTQLPLTGFTPHGNFSTSTRTVTTMPAPTHCPKAVTQVIAPKNVVTIDGAASSQQVDSTPTLDPRCRPLVSTRVVVPLNLAVGMDSTADQQVSSTMVKGRLVTTDVVKATNGAAGLASTAKQGVNSTSRR